MSQKLEVAISITVKSKNPTSSGYLKNEYFVNHRADFMG
jgi:hypothetical protein